MPGHWAPGTRIFTLYCEALCLCWGEGSWQKGQHGWRKLGTFEELKVFLTKAYGTQWESICVECEPEKHWGSSHIVQEFEPGSGTGQAC